MNRIYSNEVEIHESHDSLFFEKIVLTPSDAAKLLGVSSKTIYRMVRDHKIPHKRIGGQIRFIRHLLMNWLEKE